MSEKTWIEIGFGAGVIVSPLVRGLIKAGINYLSDFLGFLDDSPGNTKAEKKP